MTYSAVTSNHAQQATTGGLISTAGIGWLMRKYGLACDNLLAARMVTADGRLLTVSAEENADLYWGVRGGGGNFGVVTSFEYQPYPVNHVIGGMVLHPASRARYYNSTAIMLRPFPMNSL